MIPQQYITEWSEFAPWKANEQVEQDLIICRSLVELFSDGIIAEKLAFRGGTALHKLFLEPQPRYSEDIDLVEITAEPFGPLIDKIRNLLSYLGEPKIKQKDRNTTLIFSFESEIQPVQILKLKIETNCREHHPVYVYAKRNYKVDSSWFKGDCDITTYQIEELLGTKIRALYQRKKGRDLYDIYKSAITNSEISLVKLLESYRYYMRKESGGIPDRTTYLKNVESKMDDPEFLGDTTALLRPDEIYNPEDGFLLIKKEIIDKM
jgi:predicted nucleotidyltransferase component of viral defense system